MSAYTLQRVLSRTILIDLNKEHNYTLQNLHGGGHGGGQERHRYACRGAAWTPNWEVNPT